MEKLSREKKILLLTTGALTTFFATLAFALGSKESPCVSDVALVHGSGRNVALCRGGEDEVVAQGWETNPIVLPGVCKYEQVYFQSDGAVMVWDKGFDGPFQWTRNRTIDLTDGEAGPWRMENPGRQITTRLVSATCPPEK